MHEPNGLPGCDKSPCAQINMETLPQQREHPHMGVMPACTIVYASSVDLVLALYFE
jgi:hypothetical protein